jgi:hypothetical protein
MRQKALQMPLIEDDHMIQAFPSNARHCQLNCPPLYSVSTAWHAHPMNAAPRGRSRLSSYL